MPNLLNAFKNGIFGWLVMKCVERRQTEEIIVIRGGGWNERMKKAIPQKKEIKKMCVNQSEEHQAKYFKN